MKLLNIEMPYRRSCWTYKTFTSIRLATQVMTKASSDLRQSIVGSCEHDYKHSGSNTREEFVDYMRATSRSSTIPLHSVIISGKRPNDCCKPGDFDMYPNYCVLAICLHWVLLRFIHLTRLADVVCGKRPLFCSCHEGYGQFTYL
jgi:hypothetical protein